MTITPIERTVTDDLLLSKLALGDQQAFGLLYDRYWDRLLQVALHKLHDLAEAENIVQDIFVSLWNRREVLPEVRDFCGYLHASVKYRIVKQLAKSRLRVSLDNRESKGGFQENYADSAVLNEVEFKEFCELFEQAIGKLPEKAQLIYRLKVHEGKSYREIGEQLGLSEKAVDAHIFRSKKRIIASLQDYMGMFFL